MSTTDMLTGLLNRSAMDRRINQIESKKSESFMSLGIYFADVNGLKRVNDAHGHQAGDSLLVAAANLLKEVFDGYEIYRVGGDEFMVLCPNMDEEAFKERLHYTREIQKKRGDIILSIGGRYERDIAELLEDMKKADEDMYESKKLYYETGLSEKA
jgi:diguanylate cyclase (GGDEF)-like protein